MWNRRHASTSQVLSTAHYPGNFQMPAMGVLGGMHVGWEIMQQKEVRLGASNWLLFISKKNYMWPRQLFPDSANFYLAITFILQFTALLNPLMPSLLSFSPCAHLSFGLFFSCESSRIYLCRRQSRRPVSPKVATFFLDPPLAEKRGREMYVVVRASGTVHMIDAWVRKEGEELCDSFFLFLATTIISVCAVVLSAQKKNPKFFRLQSKRESFSHWKLLVGDPLSLFMWLTNQFQCWEKLYSVPTSCEIQ